jgi:hypothetical protein
MSSPMDERPIVMAVASYTSRAAAAIDLAVLCEPCPSRLELFAAALVEKGAAGPLAMIDHRITGGDSGHGRISLGAALLVIAPPLGVAFLSAGGCRVAERPAVGMMVGHFWHNVAKADLRTMSDLLEATQAALVIVSIGRAARDIAILASSASTVIVTESDVPDAGLPTPVDAPAARP